MPLRSVRPGYQEPRSLPVLPARGQKASKNAHGEPGGQQREVMVDSQRRYYSPLPTVDRDSMAQHAGHEDEAPPHYIRWEPPEEESCYSLWKRGHFTIVPEGNVFLDTWDVSVILALFIMAIVLPFDVALLKEPPRPLHILLKLIDIMFVTDIVLTFNVAYGVTTEGNRDMFERAPLKIARHYMAFPFSDKGSAGWFWWDILTVFPWEEFSAYHESWDFRLVRVMRLMRMFRLVRVVKMLTKWHMHFGYQISLINALWCICSTLLTCHWFACAWAHLAWSVEDQESTWLQAWLNLHDNGRSADECTPGEVYNLALYWCLATLTSVGYGDVLPQNSLEVALLSCTILVLCTLWAWVLAHMVSMLQNMDVFATESNQLMDDLNLLMDHRALEPGLRQRCRKHMYESFHVHRQRHQQRTVKWLSAGLQGEIAVESGVDKACDCVWYLRSISTTVLIAIAQRFVGDVFSPSEYINIRYAVSVIRKGTCVRRGRLLTRDHVIGEDMILATEHLVDTTAPRTLTFVEVLTLSRNDLISVCESHPDFDRRVRKAQIRLAVWRAIVREADAKKRGRVSILLQHAVEPGSTTQAGARVSPSFSQSIGVVGALRGFSPQESIASVVEQMGALKRRLEEMQASSIREFAVLGGRVDELREHAGLLRRRGGVGLALCGRAARSYMSS